MGVATLPGDKELRGEEEVVWGSTIVTKHFIAARDT